MNSTCLIVLGMHRSTTSLLTRSLNLLGVALPSNVMGPGPGNEAGHWEPDRIVSVHDRMLSALGSRWDDWRGLSFSLLTTSERQDFKNELLQLLKEEYGQAPLFVMKDPRVCRFVSFYSELMNEAQIGLRFVLPIRNPIAVAASLQKRDGMSESYATLIWLRHVLDAEASTRTAERAFVNSETIMQAPGEALTVLSLQLQISWPRKIEDALPDILSFIDKDLLHNTSSLIALNEPGDFSEMARSAYLTLLDLAKDPHNKNAMATLDSIRYKFNEIASTVGNATFEEMARLRLKLAAGEEEISRMRSKLAASENDLAALKELTRTNSMVNALQSVLDAMVAKAPRQGRVWGWEKAS